MKPLIYALLFTVFAFSGLKADDDPTPLEILSLVRYSHALQNHDLDGHLRKDDQKVPFKLALRNRVMRFTFRNPAQVIHLELNNESYLLREIVPGKQGPVAPEKYGERIRGTDATYEDVALRFLYWTKAEAMGTDIVRARLAWKVKAFNVEKLGPYDHVIVWVDKGSGSLLKLEAYNKKKQLIKKFGVVSGQKVDGAWLLKEMRLERIDPNTGDVLGRTYLELDKPKKGN